jgi:glutamate synthase (NADPH/NADH) small chain
MKLERTQKLILGGIIIHCELQGVGRRNHQEDLRSMGKAAGFLEYPRVEPEYRPVADRTRDYQELSGLLSEEEAQRQGARCMDCGVPFCHSCGCPLFSLIPNWNDLVYHGRWREAYEWLESTNNFPEVTGRLCPAICEAACTLAVNTSPVCIRQIELFVIERAFENGWVAPHPPAVETGRRVAVVGSGPSGSAAAQVLRRAGHSVVVFEKSGDVGGLLRYGIPDFKLEKRILDRRLHQLKQEGIQFKTRTNVGEDISAVELRRSFDAIVLAPGASVPGDLHIPGRELDGIHQAIDYLTQSNLFVAGVKKKDEIIWAENKNVLVIGGGDTGADCVGTAVRQGAKRVYQFEILPKPREWDKAFNPDWPDWPKILRSSSSHEEGCEREWSVATKQFGGSGNKIETGDFVRVDWSENPSNGAPQMTEIPGSEFTVKIDLVLLAMGFAHAEHGRLVQDLDIAIDEKGNIKTSGSYATSTPGVFVAGDAMTGASLVARAIWHGREAAASCHSYMQGLSKSPQKNRAWTES